MLYWLSHCLARRYLLTLKVGLNSKASYVILFNAIFMCITCKIIVGGVTERGVQYERKINGRSIAAFYRK